MMTGWPSRGAIFSVSTRAIVSAGPPAGNGTISLIGLLG